MRIAHGLECRQALFDDESARLHRFIGLQRIERRNSIHSVTPNPMVSTKEGVLKTMQEQTKGRQKAGSSTKEPTQAADQIADQTFRQVLDQQVADAIRPVLDEFRQQMTQELEQQAATLRAKDVGAKDSGANDTGTSGQTSGTKTPAKPVTQPEQQQPASPNGAATSLAQTLRPELEAVEQQTASALQSALAALVTALLAETTHTAIQRQAEVGLHAFIEKLFNTAPGGANNQQMQEKTERLLRSILQEFLDAIFAETLRMKVQQDGQQAIQSSLHGDFGGVLNNGGDLLKATVAVLVGVLRRNQQNLVRLALALALFMLAGLIAQSGSHHESTHEDEPEQAEE